MNGKSEIVVVVDPKTLHLSAMGGITGEVWLKVNERVFPDNRWNDFPRMVHKVVRPPDHDFRQ